MQIVIDIPDNMQEMCRWHQDCICNLTSLEVDILAEAVRNGIVLPKGHGRLIDVDEVEAILHNKAFDMVESNAKFYTIRWVQKIVRNAPTVIEADKEVDNGTDR